MQVPSALLSYVALRARDVPAAVAVLAATVRSTGASVLVTDRLAKSVGLLPCPHGLAVVLRRSSTGLAATLLGEGWSVSIGREAIHIDVPGASETYATACLFGPLDAVAEIAFLPRELRIARYELHSGFVRFGCDTPIPGSGSV